MPLLSLRERRLLGVAALALLGLATWLLVLRPGLEDRARSMDRLVALDAVSALLDRLPQGGKRRDIKDLPPPRQRVTDTARAAAVNIRRLDPQGTAVSVSLDDVAFNVLIDWLDILTGPQQMRVLSAEIVRRPEPGIVQARLVLEAGS